MFGPLGAPEIIFILLLALLIFGPRRLPEMGRTIGKAMGEFRRATTDLKRSINTEIALEDADERPKYQRGPARKSVETPAGSVDADGLLEPAPAAGTQPRDGGGEAAAEAGEEGASDAPAGDAAGTTATGDGDAATAADGETGAGPAGAGGGEGETAGGEAETDGGDRDGGEQDGGEQDGDEGEDRVAARG